MLPFFQKYAPLLVYAILPLFILWHLLLPGYILTLDMVFTPFIHFRPDYGNLVYAYPLYGLLWLLSQIVPVWILQKLMLWTAFSGMGYLAYRFLPLPDNKPARLAAGLFYTLNPFVYTRFIAGQWTVLLGYALLPLLIARLLDLLRTPSTRTSLFYFLTMWILSICSIQFFALACYLSLFTGIVFFIANLIYRRIDWIKRTIGYVVVGGIGFLLVNSYWIGGLFTRSQAFGEQFDLRHWEVFSAATRGNIPLWLNMLSLNGFWSEDNVWARSFRWPQDFPLFWISISFIFLLILFGIAITGSHLWKGHKGIPKNKRIDEKDTSSKKQRIGLDTQVLSPSVVLFFLTIGIAGYILAHGVSNSWFKECNTWLFHTLPGWAGFRDSQKLSALLSISFAFFFGWGVATLTDWLAKKRLQKVYVTVSLFALLLPFGTGFLLLGGAQGQLEPVQYPAGWFGVKETVEQDPSNAKLLLLPWHRYMPFHFANNLLLDNPANRFFGNRAVVAKNLEIGAIYDQETDSEYRDIDRTIQNNRAEAEASLQTLLRYNIRYIAKFKEIEGQDRFVYPFLKSPRLEILLQTPEVTLFRIR